MQADHQEQQSPELALAGNVDRQMYLSRTMLANGLYLLVLLGAAVMRFTELGEIPLSPSEAAEALAVWQFLQPGSEAITIGSPAYFTFTTLLIPLFGASDTVMRLTPAIFGLGMIALPWLVRRQTAVIGALVASALLAASPLNSAVSRTVGGDAIALFALMLAVVSVINLHYDFNETWYYGLAAALGVGLASSALFYSGLFLAALAWVVTRLLSGNAIWTAGLPRSTVRNAFILGALVLIGVSTRLLTYPPGIGASARLIGEWLGQFGIGGGLQSMLAPFLIVARYEIPLLLMGLAAVIWTFWRSNIPRIWLMLWLVAAFALMLLQSGILENALIATLPGYLLVGLFSAYIMRTRLASWTWALCAGLLLVGAVIFVNSTRYLRVSAFEPGLSYIWFVILALAAATLMLYYFWSMTDASITQAVWLALLLMLLYFQWGTAWYLTHSAANDPRESWVAQGTDDELRVLVRTIQDISRQEANSDNGIELLSAFDTPVLRWYLRDFSQATIGDSVPPLAQHQVILSRAAEADPQFGADFIGSDFGLLRSGAFQAQASEAPIADFLRWSLFHETAGQIIEDRVILWVRSDLVLPRQ